MGVRVNGVLVLVGVNVEVTVGVAVKVGVGKGGSVVPSNFRRAMMVNGLLG